MERLAVQELPRALKALRVLHYTCQLSNGTRALSEIHTQISCL